MNYYLGIDFGTSGARAIAISATAAVVQTVTAKNFDQTPAQWQHILWQLLSELEPSIRQNLQAIAINGTSGTVLLCDQQGQSITEALLYNDQRGAEVLPKLAQFVPSEHLVYSATSSLAKLIWWDVQGLTKQAHYFLHQADWLSFLLHSQLGISDYHNVLKLGYDVEHFTYPDWLKHHALFHLLPQVKIPGEIITPITPEIAEKFNINPACRICAGTTDSIAAFIASGVSQVGDAVTSLGSTLVLKLLSEQPVNDLKAGVYSHRLGNLWLTGGASNTGGAVLKQYFTDDQLQQLSLKINPLMDTQLNYYPLLQPGDRFPINDPHLSPCLSPRPADDVQFLQGILEGIARIEAMGYQQLQTLGASPLRQVITAGGGAKNPQWKAIRQRYLNCPVLPASQPEAAYGSAYLAQYGLGKH